MIVETKAFPSGEETIGMGHVEKITDGVAWGSLDNGWTFDLPVNPDFHHVGNQVRWDATDREETGSDYVIMVLGEQHVTILWCDENEDGFEIMGSEVIAKDAEKMN